MTRITLDPAFHFDLPQGWSAVPDEEEGVVVTGPDEVGLLHLVAFEEAGELDPAEELYGFLEDQEIELEEDEIEDLELASGAELSLCEYIAEDEEESAYCLMAVATVPGRLVLCSYSCPEGEEEAERAAIRAILGSLELSPSPPAG